MKPLFKSKISLWTSILALMVVIGIGATLALMASPSNSVTNTFAAAQVDTEIDEDLTNNNKKVTIENTGKSPVYVRARIMVSGVDPENIVIVSEEGEGADHYKVEDGEYYLAGTPEAGKLYLIMPNVTEGWEQAGGETDTDDYYYYKEVLSSGESTKSLLEKVVVGSGLVEQLKDNPNFSVTVYHESVLAINQPESITVGVVKDSFDAAAQS